MNSLTLSFVIPCLNEEKNIPETINRCKKEAKKLNIDFEIIVIDNGSIDNSKTIAKELGAKVIDEKTTGYGIAIQTGLKNASNDICLIMDADSTYDPSCLGEIIKVFINREADLVIGNRWGFGIEKDAMPPLHKYLGNPILSFIGKYLFNVKINDFHCGIRAIKTEVARNMPFSVKGMEFATEMIVLASIYKYKLEEFPTKLLKSKYKRTTHLKTWSDGWRHLSYMISMSPTKSLLYPGILIQTVSLIFLFRFTLVNNFFKEFGGINTFLISFFLSLTSFLLIKEYFETKYLLNLKLNLNEEKRKNLKVFKSFAKLAFLNLLLLTATIPIITIICMSQNINFQATYFYLIIYFLSNLIFIFLLLNILSIRLHLFDL